jgi:phosphogluconate dehydratase
LKLLSGFSMSFKPNLTLHPTLEKVTQKIISRSRQSRAVYLERLELMRQQQVRRTGLSCTNLAHGFAAFENHDKLVLKALRRPNLAIVSAYNDMLSAHQPFQHFPAIIKQAVREQGAVAQFAGATPAMCDGVTQGQPGMELSLFSRDVIAMATAIALSHNMFDAAVYLGVCDKIVPGLLIGALHFGHLPGVFIPAGPMTSGLSNDEKSEIRKRYAQGLVTREELLEAESRAYHGPGTCTFYGTANSNQFLMEIMGLHVPGAAFVHPGTRLRDALTAHAAKTAISITALDRQYLPIGKIVDEYCVVNAMVGLLATGGSTNHTIHLIAIARAAGIQINWSDFDELSGIVPLLARIYPNGSADINQFHAAGGSGLTIRELLQAGLLHERVQTVMGRGLGLYTQEPYLCPNEGGHLEWREAPVQSMDLSVLRSVQSPFQFNGGLRLLQGNLGRAVVKISAVAAEHRVIRARAIVFDDQEDLLTAYQAGELNQDFVAVIRFQGPKANGMPELHKLTPTLSVLQDQGYRVALVTDGRMSGASGKVNAAIHVTPECLDGGALAKVRTGDWLVVDAEQGRLHAEVSEAEWEQRPVAKRPSFKLGYGSGRELFALFRQKITQAEQGACTFSLPGEEDA